MVYNRTGTAPWSLSREAGIQSATVDSTIEVPQYLQPTINTGVIDLEGNWKGVTSSDTQFLIDPEHLAIPNGATVLSPQRADHEYIDMTGFNDLFFAVKVSNGGNYAMSAVMGPDTYPFANLTPVNSAAELRFCAIAEPNSDSLTDVYDDSAESFAADVWNIIQIQQRASGQKLLQFKIVNNSGGESNIQFASLRVV